MYLLWFNFIFGSILFSFVFVYDNELKTKENKIEPRIKLNHNRYYIHDYVCIPIFDSNYFIVFFLVLHYFTLVFHYFIKLFLIILF